MRLKLKPVSKHGDYRIRQGFLFLPKIMNQEWRWLEKAKWEQKYHVYDFDSYWSDVRWVD